MQSYFMPHKLSYNGRPRALVAIPILDLLRYKLLKRPTDVAKISDMYAIPHHTIRNALRDGRGSEEVIKALKEFYG